MKTIALVVAREGRSDRTMTLAEFEAWRQQENERMLKDLAGQVGEFFGHQATEQAELLAKGLEDGLAQD